ncbi:hypothetical protein PoB_003931300 [Plakobranchus ocellatus]|uniref:TraD/TraG TraM recognition site domain-containing protein n=1 Tax=Plakobranchus ocellatus TaxID=259542 RepID=A0AAV4B258_9GAST|nr:hypothetical protein PoB_003931300 [Plakobranchus ocellatus]
MSVMRSHFALQDGSEMEAPFYLHDFRKYRMWENFFLVKQLISYINLMVTPVPEEIIWCYGIWQHAYEEIASKVLFSEGLPKIESDDGKCCLVIVDDLMTEADKTLTDLFTKACHHKNISVIHIVQNLFGKNKEQRTLSLNSHYLVIFKNPRDMSQISYLARQMYPGNSRYVEEAYKDATKSPHGYLLLDLKQSTPDNLRLRTSIFPSDPVQTVYLPTKQ